VSRHPPRVSVVLPVRNAAPFLPAALESIRAQTLREWELIAIDNGSTDASAEILRDAARSDPRIRFLREARPGIVHALNLGLAAASSPLVARMDADDISHPDRLRLQAGCLEREPDLGLVGCRVEFGGDHEAAAGYAAHVAWLNDILTHRDIELARFIESPIAHPSVMFRRDLVSIHGGYRDGDFPEDYELWLRWLDAGVRMRKLPETLLRWNDPPGRLSRVAPRYSAEAFHRIKAPYLARWYGREVDPGRRLVIWGAGRLTRRRAEWIARHGLSIRAWIDVDPRKQGRSHLGAPVWTPDFAAGQPDLFIIGYVGTRGAREAQRAFLTGHGRVEGRDFIFAA